MTTNGFVTIYHLSADGGGYSPSVHRASVYFGGGVRSDSCGFSDDSFCKIRIPSSRGIDISCNDYVFIGKTDAPLNKDRCFRVSSFAFNGRGGQRHVRIECARVYRR